MGTAPFIKAKNHVRLQYALRLSYIQAIDIKLSSTILMRKIQVIDKMMTFIYRHQHYSTILLLNDNQAPTRV